MAGFGTKFFDENRGFVRPPENDVEEWNLYTGTGDMAVAG